MADAATLSPSRGSVTVLIRFEDIEDMDKEVRATKSPDAGGSG